MNSKFALLAFLSVAAPLTLAADVPPPKQAVDSRAVMTGEEVIRILDETVDWYRTLGTQQQAATQPSDLLILYANRQTADKVVALAFEIARANAELISSEVGAAQANEAAASSTSLLNVRKRLDEQRDAIQSEIESARRELGSAPAKQRADLRAKVALLQSELDLINARRNLLANMTQFSSQNDAEGFGANALKAHIDAIAASIPTSAAPAATPTVAEANPSGSSVLSASLTDFGVWDLGATVLRLSAKGSTIETVDRRTADLLEVFRKVRAQPQERLKELAARGDALAAQQGTDSAVLRTTRDQYDTLAWLFQQTSAIVTPLSRAEVLLNQYRRNLNNWREATQKQYHEALVALGIRIAIFAGLLALVFVIAEAWRRAVYRYVHDVRRRSRFLLLRRIVLWLLILALVAATFATELSSLATFAGLITAGLAVAMQSVLVSVVGYFFLIGKYGIRVGDRVQIGSVSGEVIDLGLVRLHLMELSGEGSMSPTGRVVAFANSIIFQASGGLFKQIPGVNFAWHEITLSLPPGADYPKMKDRLVQAVTNVIKDYREDILRQTREIQKTASSNAAGDAQPQVQLHFSASGVEALVRYPVQLQHAAEIDERVSRELLSVVSADETQRKA
jgi:small-conductance mechanosensitive channel